MAPLPPVWWPGAALALAVGAVLLASRRDAWAACLATIVCAPALALQPLGATGGDAPMPAALLQLISPGLFTVGRGAPLASLHLGAFSAPWPASLVIGVGLPGLLLALLGLVVARDPAGWLGRILAALALGLGLGGSAPPAWSAAALLASLGLLAGSGLSVLRRKQAEGAAMALSWVSIALAAGLAMAALQAGAATDAEALAAWTPAGVRPSGAELATLAEALRAVLDRLALSAFAAMTVLLVFLKTRGPVGTVLLVLVALADAARPWWGA